MLSGAVNILLAAYLLFPYIKDNPAIPAIVPVMPNEAVTSARPNLTNKQVLGSFKERSFDQLLHKLTDPTLVENGYTVRDLALGYLAGNYYFDVNRAIGSQSLEQRRQLVLDKDKKIDLFPGMTDLHFLSIKKFAQVERWPFTAEGLFYLLKKNRQNSSLADAFFLTNEFINIELLFSYNKIEIPKKRILEILLDGGWAAVQEYLAERKKSQDTSQNRLREWLLGYVRKGSKTAAYVLIEKDFQFALLKLDNNDVIKVLSLLTDHTVEAKQFALAALTSPRNDAVWQLAAVRLYEYEGEEAPKKFLHHAALSRFVPRQEIQANEGIVEENASELPKAPAMAIIPKKQPAQQRYKIYVVQEGDSLWKISKRFKVDIEVIKKHNKIEGDLLKPGAHIKLPG